MSAPKLRALVLAAGYGRRLSPLTASLPKPLLPVLGRPLLSHTLDQLSRIGCEACAINLHHLPEQIPSQLGVSWRGMPLHYSREARLRGTLGALYPLRDFLGAADVVLVVNGDSLCRWPLRALVRRHRRHNAAATMLLARRADPRQFGGGVGVDADGLVRDFSGSATDSRVTERLVFAGAQAWSPELLSRVPDGTANTVDHLYRPLLREGVAINSLTTRRKWRDLGTPQRYLEGVLERARGPLRSRWVAPDAHIHPTAKVGQSVVESRARLAERAQVLGSVILPGATIGRSSELTGVLVGGGVELPDGSRVAHRLITMARAGEAAPPGSSRVGNLVYTPLHQEVQ